ncbi:MAG: hypothetical protein CYPHOPRED_001891 [Cyphobasidiales sp. Tagirdzhanova-0007]|nr:MAG: hypothetical protein CYPHOPRED_001891 [Cyphobasidiales sp. Tagirdzhanova-0007]
MTSRPGPALPERQAVYWTTGACAGVASLLSVSASHRLLPQTFPATPIHFPALRHAFAAAGTRFLAFDLCRDTLKDVTREYPTLRGAVSGCVGGLAETLQGALVATLLSKSVAPLRPTTLAPALVSHGGTLFLCFGGYTFLSTHFSQAQPPAAPLCYLLGGLAGAAGVPLVHLIKTRSFAGCAKIAATGFVRVGVVIGTQVISSAKILALIEGQRTQPYEGS